MVRSKLPPPASVQVYGLTEWGYEADQLLIVLGRWAARSPGHDATLPLSNTSLMLSFRTMFQADAAGDTAVIVGFRLGEDTFQVRVENGTLTPQRAGIDDADVVFTTTPETMAAYVYGKASLEALEEAGRMVVEGNRKAALKFQPWFTLPPKAPV